MSKRKKKNCSPAIETLLHQVEIPGRRKSAKGT
jgi:hypothetical protein